MIFKRFLAVSILAATCAFSISDAGAQTLRKDKGPAELPPASFKANQYVDSKGCVYIRAGVDGNTSWVPRVSRSRKVVCGLSPSLRSGGTTAVAAAPKAAAPARIVATNPTPKSPAAVRPAATTIASVLAPKPVRTVASKPVVKTRVAPSIQRVNRPQASGLRQLPRNIQVGQAPQRRVQPKTIQRKPQQVQAIQPRRIVTSQTCRGINSGGASSYSSSELAALCGRQSAKMVKRGGTMRANSVRAGSVQGGTFRTTSGRMLDPSSVSPNAIIVPRHVYEQQQATRVTQPVPNGYRQAWQDDRLNSRRQHQTLAGKAQMDLIWTKTVPRRLIARSTGRDVTRSFPGLRYPYTSAAQQNAAWSQGQRVVSTQGQAPRRVQQAQVVRKQARVSTRTSTPRKPAAVAGKRYVQVGTFGVESNARNTANRIQRMGLPVRIGKFSRNGKVMRIVLAGPFGSAANTGGALQAVRSAGFRDAFARN